MLLPPQTTPIKKKPPEGGTSSIRIDETNFQNQRHRPDTLPDIVRFPAHCRSHPAEDTASMLLRPPFSGVRLRCQFFPQEFMIPRIASQFIPKKRCLTVIEIIQHFIFIHRFLHYSSVSHSLNRSTASTIAVPATMSKKHPNSATKRIRNCVHSLQ